MAPGLATWQVNFENFIGWYKQFSEAQLQHFIFVQYEEIYAETRAINALFTRLGLSNLEPEKLEPFVAKFAELNTKLVPRRDDIRMQVAQNADSASYKHLTTHMTPLP